MNTRLTQKMVKDAARAAGCTARYNAGRYDTRYPNAYEEFC